MTKFTSIILIRYDTTAGRRYHEIIATKLPVSLDTSELANRLAKQRNHLYPNMVISGVVMNYAAFSEFETNNMDMERTLAENGVYSYPRAFSRKELLAWLAMDMPFQGELPLWLITQHKGEGLK